MCCLFLHFAFIFYPSSLLLSRGGSRSREHREGGSAGLVDHPAVQQDYYGQNDHADQGQLFQPHQHRGDHQPNLGVHQESQGTARQS